jgi:hypothetical protein
MGLNTFNYSRPNINNLDNRVTFNIVQSCIDTLTSKIGSNKPRPTFLTEDGKWEQQLQAQNLDKYVRGVFYQSDVYKASTRAFVDGAVFGTGFLKVYRDQGRICVEKILSDEVFVDDVESMYGSPLNKYQRKAVQREALLDMYPKFKAEINALMPLTDSSYIARKDLTSDMVEVFEGWHLPSKRNGKDGRHVICIEGADLLDDTYKKNRFPIIPFRYNPRLFGYYGQGLSEQLTGIQVEVNKLLRLIQTAHHLMASPAVYIAHGSNVVKSHINNEVGRIITYTGQPPEYRVFQTIHPEVYQHLERLYTRGFEIAGLSQMSASSIKPAGLDSGRALREAYNIESERFKDLERRWEEFHLDVAKAIIEEAQEAYEMGENIEVKSDASDFIKTIKWSDVNLDESSYVMKCFPASSLPKEPAGKMMTIQELMQSGLIDGETGMELLDFPDLEATTANKFAPRKLIKKQVEQILYSNEYDPPEPFMDLGFCQLYAQLVYNKAKMDKAPEERLELLRRYMEQAKELQDSAAQELQAQQVQQQQLMAPAMPEGV